MGEELIDYRVKVLKALADPVRLRIIEFLRGGERCVCEIVPFIGKAQPTVSKHLDILHDAGVLDRRVDGKKVLYRVRSEAVLQLLRALDALILDSLSPMAEALKRLEEGPGA